jgi:hypothetical protein
MKGGVGAGAETRAGASEAEAGGGTAEGQIGAEAGALERQKCYCFKGRCGPFCISMKASALKVCACHCIFA